MAMTIGEALREARQRRELWLRDVENLTQMSSSELSQVETDVRADPAFSTVVRFAQALGMSLDFLVETPNPSEVPEALDELERIQNEMLWKMRTLEKLISVVRGRGLQRRLRPGADIVIGATKALALNDNLRTKKRRLEEMNLINDSGMTSSKQSRRHSVPA